MGLNQYRLGASSNQTLSLHFCRSTFSVTCNERRHLIVIVPGARASSRSAFIQVDDECMCFQARANGPLKAIAVVSGPAVQIEKWRPSWPRTSRYFVPKPHSVENDVVFARRDGSLATARGQASSSASAAAPRPTLEIRVELPCMSVCGVMSIRFAHRSARLLMISMTAEFRAI